jgi:YaiO family outer membrane protein
MRNLLQQKRFFVLLCLFNLGIPAVYAQKVSADELLQQALIATNQHKNYPEAIKLVQEGLRVSPDYIDIRVLLARLYLLSERYEDAIQELNKVLVKQPNHADALKYMVNANYQARHTRDAIKYIAQYLNYYPTDQQMLLKKIAMLHEIDGLDEAKQELKHALEKYPNDTNLVYLNKTVSFSAAKASLLKKDTLQTLTIYKQLLNEYPGDTTVRNQLIGLETARHQYANAIKYIESGLGHYQNQDNLLLKKIGLLQQIGAIQEANQLAKVLYNNNPNNKKAKAIYDELFILSTKNQLIVNYAFTAFDQPGKKKWDYYSLSYARTEKFGTLIGRVNYADRINSNGYQFEIEAYPKHPVGYSFVNLSYANTIVFPKMRFSYSYFLPLKKGWGAEIGLRYLKNDNGFLGFTGAVDKYINRFWLNLRGFFMYGDKKLSSSCLLTSRYYLNDSPDNYFTAIIGYGFSPDDRGINFEINERLNMQSMRLTLAYQFKLWNSNVLGLSTTLNKQQYEIGRNTNEYETAIVFKHRW